MNKNRTAYLSIMLISILLLSSCTTNIKNMKQENNIDSIHEQKSLITEPIISLINRSEVENNLKELTSTPRKRGTDDNVKAGVFLFNKMKSYGYDVKFQEFKGHRTASLAQMLEEFNNLNPNNEEPIFNGRNIICQRSDFDSNLPTVIFSAHYDTTTDNIGVLDNASGVCALLEVARILNSAKLDYNIKFIFFDSEEYYLQGSRYYVKLLNDDEIRNIYANINVDMVGNEKARDLIFVAQEDEELYRQAQQIFSDKQIKCNQWGQSDDMSFRARKIKCIRYTSVDIFSKEFEPKIWTKEDDSSWVNIDRLLEDIDIIGTYAIELKI